MKKLCLSVVALLMGSTLFARQSQKPLMIADQGSFLVGGTKSIQPGVFDIKDALKPQGQTFHGDHAYAFYQVPVKARKYPLVFLHGAGQSKKTWESTPEIGRAHV